MTFASPSTTNYALNKGVNPEALAKELGQNFVSRADVDRKLGGGVSSPSSTARYWDVDHAQYGEVEIQPLSKLELLSAQNLQAATQTIPSVTHHDEADMTKIEAFRKFIKPEAIARDIRVTALAFHVKALAHCLGAFPRFNASLTADGSMLIMKKFVHIGIAIDTAYGLIVPVIRDANTKGIWEISAAIQDLATRAKIRKIRPTEMGGASMTISNLGGIGGTAFTPIINPPEVAILGITKSFHKPVWNGSTFEPKLTLPLDLTYDHRVINGADAARFMSYLAKTIGNPAV